MAAIVRCKIGGKLACRRDSLLHRLVERRFVPNGKRMGIRSALSRAQSGFDNRVLPGQPTMMKRLVRSLGPLLALTLFSVALYTLLTLSVCFTQKSFCDISCVEKVLHPARSLTPRT